MRLDTTNKDHYDIMAALRGPDGNGLFSGYCKLLFTSRIRYWVGCERRRSGGVVRSEKTVDAFIQQALSSAPAEAPAWWLHYRAHIRDALRALLRMSPQRFRDFSRKEATRLLAALDGVNAALCNPVVDEEELPF